MFSAISSPPFACALLRTLCTLDISDVKSKIVYLGGSSLKGSISVYPTRAAYRLVFGFAFFNLVSTPMAASAAAFICGCMLAVKSNANATNISSSLGVCSATRPSSDSKAAAPEPEPEPEPGSTAAAEAAGGSAANSGTDFTVVATSLRAATSEATLGECKATSAGRDVTVFRLEGLL